FLGRLLVPLAPFGISGWRWMFVIGSLGAAIIWFMRSNLPESPRWLESVGRGREADAITRGMEREASVYGPLAPPDAAESADVGRASFAVILSGPYRRRTIMLGVCH